MKRASALAALAWVLLFALAINVNVAHAFDVAALFAPFVRPARSRLRAARSSRAQALNRPSFPARAERFRSPRRAHAIARAG